MERYRENLWKFLQRADTDSLTLTKRIDLAIKLIKELRVAHEGGVVHRDLKPTNIMVNGDNDELTIVDFGIGRDDYEIKDSSGTPGFNAQEQFSGDKQSSMEDMFTLGKNLVLLLFEWKVGWNILFSSKELIDSEYPKSSELIRLSEVIRCMLQVVKLITAQYCLLTHKQSSYL